jgi:hypothetical protein
MGIILFWIHDRSPKHRRTYRLIDHTVELVDRLIYLASNPFMRLGSLDLGLGTLVFDL